MPRACRRISRPRIETLRFASGNEEIRAALYEQLGDDLFEKPAAVRDELAKLVDKWGQDDAGDDEENGEGGGKKGLPEKTKRKLLDPDTWKRDAALVGIRVANPCGPAGGRRVDWRGCQACCAAFQAVGVNSSTRLMGQSPSLGSTSCR